MESTRLMAALGSVGMLVLPGEARAGALQVVVEGGLTVVVGADGLRPGLSVGASGQWLFADTGTFNEYVDTWRPAPVVGGLARVGWQGGTRFWVEAGGNGGIAWEWCCGYETFTTDGLVGAEVAANLRLGAAPRLYAGAFAADGPSDEIWAGGSPPKVDVMVRGGVLIGRDSSARVGLGLGSGLLAIERSIAPNEGRPYRVRSGARTPRVLVRGAVDPEAARWIAEGRAELASVATFRRLGAELAALGAPAALVQRARAAATEEVGHALLCLDMAARRAGPVAAAPLTWAPRRFPSREVGLTVLAREAVEDGVVGEGDAAVRAAVAASAVRDDRTARAKARIARDEAGHAALGGDVAAWCAAAGG
jgi:hypothetical protein